jgi:hypothetical protein
MIHATIDEVPAGRDLDMEVERAVFGQPSPVVPAYYSTGFSFEPGASVGAAAPRVDHHRGGEGAACEDSSGPTG